MRRPSAQEIVVGSLAGGEASGTSFRLSVLVGDSIPKCLQDIRVTNLFLEQPQIEDLSNGFENYKGHNWDVVGIGLCHS